MGITIRKVLPEDVYDYTVCHIACWNAAFRGIVSDEYLDNMSAEIEERVERLKKTLDRPGNSEFYCVIFEGRMIGRLIIGKSQDEDKPDAGAIVAIYLLDEFWGKGYGREMMDFAIGALKRLGYREVVLWTPKENERAKRFYEKYGFTADGATKEMGIGKALVIIRYVFNIRE